MNDQQYKEVVFVPSIPIFRKEVEKDEYLNAYNKKIFSNYWQLFPFRSLIENHQPLLAILEIKSVLTKCRGIDEKIYCEFHKGNPYYWLGVASFVIRDFESAAYFMDSAAREDLKLQPPNYPSPATNFISLRGEPDNQAAKNLVLEAQGKLEELINIYNKECNFPIYSNKLELEDIRKCFLDKSVDPKIQKWPSLATTLISFILEYPTRIEQLLLVDKPNSKEPFMIHLFKGSVLFESLLRSNPLRSPKGNQLKDYLNDLANELRIPKGLNINCRSLNNVFIHLNNLSNNITDSIQLSGKIRNTTGHFLDWDIELNVNDYKEVYKRIGSSCLYVISSLFRE